MTTLVRQDVQDLISESAFHRQAVGVGQCDCTTVLAALFSILSGGGDRS